MAVGLGSMDMPVPLVSEWEWLNWKFPRAVRAGETIYARWTLTQKRAPVGGSPTAIVVWRVDVHTASGALCAEGEVGASVMRGAGTAQARAVEPPAVAAGSAPRRRGRRRASAGDGAKKAVEAKAVATAEAPVAAKTPNSGSAEAPAPERAAGRPRRRRRRRSPGAAAARNGDAPVPAASSEASPAAAPVSAVPVAAGTGAANPISRAIRRLRGGQATPKRGTSLP